MSPPPGRDRARAYVAEQVDERAPQPVAQAGMDPAPAELDAVAEALRAGQEPLREGTW